MSVLSSNRSSNSSLSLKSDVSPLLVKLRNMFASCGVPIEKETYKMGAFHAMFKSADLDGNGKISLIEFRTLIHKMQRVTSRRLNETFDENEVDELYDIIDCSNSGNLRLETFFGALMVCRY